MIAAPSSPQTAAFVQLQDMVREAELPPPRSEADEDRMAMEDLIWLKMGALPLMRYRRMWRGGQ